ncbi:MAG: glycogen phosphorylase, partial [Phototrophicales bacterium]
LYPNKINNKTNGITPRRWLRSCNPRLSRLLDDTIGANWTKDLEQLRQLEPFAKNAEFQEEFMNVKRENKKALAKIISEQCHIDVSPDAMFDVQIKRLHEYKRQHLNLFHILTLYHRILKDPSYDMVPRVFIFGAKAAPGYYLAKEIIYAINCVASR